MNKEKVAESNFTGYDELHLQYLPFGELFVSQRNGSFDSRYMFTAKELITYHLERKMYNLVLCNFVNVPIKPHIIYALLAKILKER
jgi:hypothetical protein